MPRPKSARKAPEFHDITAQFWDRTGVVPLRGRPQPPRGAVAPDLAALPTIIRKAQWVRFADRTFHVRREGLYRFWDWGRVRMPDPDGRLIPLETHHRYGSVIVFRNDVVGLLASIAAVQLHGDRHECMSFEDQLAQLKRGCLSMTCGPVTHFLVRLLSGLGVRARPVDLLRVEGRYNTYDCGHVILEFYSRPHGKWVAVDMDLHATFSHRGRPLNAAEVSACLARGEEPQFEPLTMQWVGTSDPSDALDGGFGWTPIVEALFGDPQLRLQWYRRVFAVVLHFDDGGVMCHCATSPLARRRAAKMHPTARRMDPDAWQERFYGEGAGGA